MIHNSPNIHTNQEPLFSQFITVLKMTSSALFSPTPFLNHQKDCKSLTNFKSLASFTCSCTSVYTHFRNPKERAPKLKIRAIQDSTRTSATTIDDPSVVSATPSEISYTDEENEAMGKVGARVKVKVPLKVYHVPKVSEFDLNGLEGEIKQFVGVWKGKRISANLPFKVQFVVEKIEGRDGPVKFFAHLKEDEFEYLD
ncbi:ferredoxin-thioredoxin reductase subunit A2, chloroplastic [Daucus carota subsp. sativus]|nr:PREDICTED: ferredoxin-thioredoxin reductase, variable chain, chloroplastic-like [Daucus carota subsp. sativus]